MKPQPKAMVKTINNIGNGTLIRVPCQFFVQIPQPSGGSPPILDARKEELGKEK